LEQDGTDLIFLHIGEGFLAQVTRQVTLGLLQNVEATRALISGRYPAIGIRCPDEIVRGRWGKMLMNCSKGVRDVGKVEPLGEFAHPQVGV